ncbi:MAG: hypothetical protein JWM68_5121 [Verrucomicrobiales bacterium]|nr:hypothetical protein [Verrucomicrobiales bacterium]
MLTLFRIRFFRNARAVVTLAWMLITFCATAENEREIKITDVGNAPIQLHATNSEEGFTWWLPSGADEFVFPISAGIVVEATKVKEMPWLWEGSPWSLTELPVVGARYGDRILTVVVPWPLYAELMIGDRVGIKYSFPPKRTNATPSDVVVLWTGKEPLEVARAFRDWRDKAKDIGEIPRRISLKQKAEALPRVTALFGAPHIYLWGAALFSQHDVKKNKWLPFAKFMMHADATSPAGKVVQHFSKSQREALKQLAVAEFPMDYLTNEIASGLEEALRDPLLFGQSTNLVTVDVLRRNREKIADALKEFVNPPNTWGDGPSIPMLNALHDAGIERAAVFLSDLYGTSLRPDVAVRATELGYVFGPYDSYHSVHDPKTSLDKTWETAQFDTASYEQGRILNADGTGHHGFKGNGYHFSPTAAWPYVQKRVGGLLAQVPYSTWFMDCDATAECFDDYSPLHSGSRVDDINARRQRLRWLGNEQKLVVASEGGSILFADVIHIGHGVQTPYIGHLDKAFRDPQSVHFLGKHWPPDSPQVSFKAVPVPPALLTPYFDPQIRIPLYQAALGDELIATHHWSFDSLKFSDVAVTRELMEILYMVPPMYHLNRSTWPARKERIVRHVKFWAPLHRQLATAPLTRFEWLTKDRLVQRTTFGGPVASVTITVNFGLKEEAGVSPQSAMVYGLPGLVSTSFNAGR